jgi:hypothetical protein
VARPSAADFCSAAVAVERTPIFFLTNLIYFQVFTFNARYSSMTCVTLTLTSPVDFRGESTNETNNLSRKVTSREGTSSERAALHRDVAREVARWQHAAGARARAHRRGYRLGVA